MKIAILSGKGGAGKTFAAVNLAAAAGKSVYIDCDIEEPNGRLFLKPEVETEESVTVKLPKFDKELCDGCRLCVDLCRFNALTFVGGSPMLFPEVCHSCGLCRIACPRGAVSEIDKPIGTLEIGKSGDVRVVTGCMNPGEATGLPIIDRALSHAGKAGELTFIDCPPGSACSVMDCVKDSDYCLLVAEATAFGTHNFKMVYELCRLFGKPCGVVINKADTEYPPLEDYCREHSIPILRRIPYSEALARCGANAELAYYKEEYAAELFDDLLSKIKAEVKEKVGEELEA